MSLKFFNGSSPTKINIGGVVPCVTNILSNKTPKRGGSTCMIKAFMYVSLNSLDIPLSKVLVGVPSLCGRGGSDVSANDLLPS